jgi:hypothetical protein
MRVYLRDAVLVIISDVKRLTKAEQTEPTEEVKERLKEVDVTLLRHQTAFVVECALAELPFEQWSGAATRASDATDAPAAADDDVVNRNDDPSTPWAFRSDWPVVRPQTIRVSSMSSSSSSSWWWSSVARAHARSLSPSLPPLALFAVSHSVTATIVFFKN